MYVVPSLGTRSCCFCVAGLPVVTDCSFPSQLDYGTAWQRLKDVFRRAGSVAHVDILSGADGRSRGCAVVSFDHPDDATRAIGQYTSLVNYSVYYTLST